MKNKEFNQPRDSSFLGNHNKELFANSRDRMNKTCLGLGSQKARLKGNLLQTNGVSGFENTKGLSNRSAEKRSRDDLRPFQVMSDRSRFKTVKPSTHHGARQRIPKFSRVDPSDIKYQQFPLKTTFLNRN